VWDYFICREPKMRGEEKLQEELERIVALEKER